jgi:hypothetical protein
MKMRLLIKGQKLTSYTEDLTNLREFLVWNKGRTYKDAAYTSICFIRWVKERYTKFGVIND